MTTKRISIKTREARIVRRRRYHYYNNTPLIKLIKPEYHHMFRRWYQDEMKTFLKNAEDFDYSEIFWFDFKMKPYMRSTKEYSYSAFCKSLAGFLKSIKKKDGTTYGISMIFRYLTDKKHSNLWVEEKELKASIYKEF